MSNKEEITEILRETTLKSSVSTVDIADYTFDQDGVKAVLQNDSERFYLSPIACAQLCKFLKVPAKFVENNPIRLNVEIFKEWLPKLKESKTDIITIEDSSGNTIIRGFYPHGKEYLSYSRFWNILKETCVEDDLGAVIDFSGGGLASSHFSVRIALSTDLNFNGHHYRPMVEVHHSDIGDISNLTVDVGFINLANFTGFMIRDPKGKPLRTWSYKKGLSVQAFIDFLSTLDARFKEAWQNAEVEFNAAGSNYYSGQALYDLLTDIGDRKGISSRHMTSIRNDLFVKKKDEEAPAPASLTMFGIAKMICDKLEDTPTFRRVKTEAFASKLMNLTI